MSDYLDTLQITLLIAQRSELGPEWNQADTADAFNRVYCVESGAAWLRHHGREIRMQPGELHLIPAQTRLSFGCPAEVTIQWAHFTATVLGGLNLFSVVDCPYKAVPGPQDAAPELMRQLREEAGRPDTASALSVRSRLLRLLAILFRESPPDDGDIGAGLLRFQPVLHYVETHLHRPLRVPELARLMHVDTAHFSRLFTKALGVSPARYLLRRRVERVQRLLWETEDTLAAIADRTGFSDAFHLSKTFKRVTGIPPRDFRRNRAAPLP